MKAEYVNPFYQALTDVFKLMLDLEITRIQAKEKNDRGSEQEVTVIIKLIGDVSGAIMFNFPQSMTLEIVKILSGLEMKELDSFVTSVLAEMSNIISGNAVTYLSKENYRCDILPPQIIIGESGSVPVVVEPMLTLPLHTEIGDLKLQISLAESKTQ